MLKKISKNTRSHIPNSTTKSTPASADQRLSDPGAGEPYIDIAPVAIIRAQGHANGPTRKLPSGTPQDQRAREHGKQAPSAQRRRLAKQNEPSCGILTVAQERHECLGKSRTSETETAEKIEIAIAMITIWNRDQIANTAGPPTGPRSLRNRINERHRLQE